MSAKSAVEAGLGSGLGLHVIMEKSILSSNPSKHKDFKRTPNGSHKHRCPSHGSIVYCTCRGTCRAGFWDIMPGWIGCINVSHFLSKPSVCKLTLGYIHTMMPLSTAPQSRSIQVPSFPHHVRLRMPGAAECWGHLRSAQRARKQGCVGAGVVLTLILHLSILSCNTSRGIANPFL